MHLESVQECSESWKGADSAVRAYVAGRHRDAFEWRNLQLAPEQHEQAHRGLLRMPHHSLLRRHRRGECRELRDVRRNSDSYILIVFASPYTVGCF